MKDLESPDLSWSDVRKRFVDNAIQLPEDAPAEAQRAERNSEAMQILKAFLEEGIRMAKERKLEPASEETLEILDEAHDLASSIAFAGSYVRLPFDMSERAKLTLQDVRHIFRVTHDAPPQSLVEQARLGKKMEVDKAEFESAVGGYLSSAFRIPICDRVLLVALIDMEVTAYLQHVYERNILTGRSLSSAMDRTPFASWAIGRAWAVLRLVVVVSALVGIAMLEWLSQDTVFLLILVAFAFFALGTVISFFAYLMFRPKWQGLIPMMVDLPAEMIGLYREMHSGGPLSVKRMRHEIQRLADKGTVWPGAVWSLLDDLEARQVISLN